jgi:hypothetical protein
MAKPLTADAVRGLVAKVASPVAAPDVAVSGDESAATVVLTYPSVDAYGERCHGDHAAVSSLAAWRLASAEVDSLPLHHKGAPAGVTVSTFYLTPAPQPSAASPATKPARDA